MEKTALDIVTKSFEAIGIKSEHESVLKAERASYGFDLLCAMLDSWRTDDTLAQTWDLTKTIPVTIGNGTYTVGASGSDFVVSERPENIIRAWVLDGGNTYPLTQVTSSDYFGTYRNNNSGGRPALFYYGQGFPQSDLVLYPAPSSTMDLYINYASPIEIPTSLNSSMTYGPAYMEAVIYSLAQRLGITYNVLNESVNAIAQQAREKLSISRVRQPNDLKIDPASTMQGSCGQTAYSSMRYNINTNGYQ